MYKLFFLTIVLTIFSACGNNSADEPGFEDDSTTISFFWQAYLDDSTGKIEMRKLPANDTMTAQAIINFLNKGYPNIKLELVKTSNDTVYIRIPESIYLTQQMGSTGPMLYFSEVVYNLTEIPGIREVNFDFEEGDHATPGPYNRKSFDKE